MAELDKVIKGLEYCIADEYCDECPYTDDCFEANDAPYGEQLMRNALELLKEYKNEKERNPVIVCPHCGKRVK